jgi:hypothetical protein
MLHPIIIGIHHLLPGKPDMENETKEGGWLQNKGRSVDSGQCSPRKKLGNRRNRPAWLVLLDSWTA